MPNVECLSRMPKAGKTTELKPKWNKEAATRFVALENNAYSKCRYLPLMIHDAYLEWKSIREQIERRLETGVTFPCHATCILARVPHVPGSHRFWLRADLHSATFAFNCRRQLSRVVLSKFLTLFLTTTEWILSSGASSCSSEKQTLHYVNPPHLTWVAVLFRHVLCGSWEVVLPRVTCPSRSWTGCGWLEQVVNWRWSRRWSPAGQLY